MAWFAKAIPIWSGASYSSANCDIKGNISQNAGERIYHVPSQRYYDSTVISPRYGRALVLLGGGRAGNWLAEGLALGDGGGTGGFCVII